MMENSRISWTDHTFNPWIGCTKVSPACANCYAERDMDHRFGKATWGPMGTRVVTYFANWMKPRLWNELAGARGVRYRVFCASLADVFEDWRGPMVDSQHRQLFCEDVSRYGIDVDEPVTMDAVRRRLFALIDATPNLDWLLLTKRPENIRKMWIEGEYPNPAGNKWRRKNVWIGTTVENQEQADKRIPELLKCRDLSPVLFLSCEPLLGAIRLQQSLNLLPFQIGVGEAPLHWVIAGGESGPNARPSNPAWFRMLRGQCQAANIPFHFKQWGEWASVSEVEGNGEFYQFSYGQTVRRVGVKKAGRTLDGKTWDEFPEVRQ